MLRYNKDTKCVILLNSLEKCVLIMNKDKRSIRTETTIQNSLMQLLTYKSLTKITITELTKLAGIERKTFYLHYDSIDEVLTEIENNLQTDLDSRLESQPELTADKLLEILNDLMIQKKSFYQGILISSPNIFLNDDFQLILQRCLKKYFFKSLKLPQIEARNYYASFLAAGIVQCYREYLEKPNGDIAVLNSILKKIINQFNDFR